MRTDREDNTVQTRRTGREDSLHQVSTHLGLVVATIQNASLAAQGALANRLQRRTTRKANEANLDPPNQKSEITSL